VAQLLRARIRGTPPPSDAPRLEAALAACCRIASTVHRIDFPIARRRTLDVELVGLRAAVEIVRSYAPGLAARLEPALVAAESRAARTQAAADVTAHGDFSYTQLLFAGDRQG